MKAAETNSAESQAKGEKILIGLGVFLTATWAVFAAIYLQGWLEARQDLANSPAIYEVSDQGILTLLSTPLLGIFAVLFIGAAKKRKEHQGPIKVLTASGLSILGIAAMAVPLEVIDNKMNWYITSASATPYVMCEEVRHGKGKNTWRSFVYVREDVGCQSQ